MHVRASATRLFVVALLVALLVCGALSSGCSSTGGGESPRGAERSSPARPGDPRTSPAPRTNAGPANADDEDAPAQNRVVKDARIIALQAENPTPVILVNRRHSLRATAEGRRAIAGGAGRTYKAISDRAIEALIESLEAREIARFREPWVEGDQQYLKDTSKSIPGFKGVIVVENNGERYKVIGWKPKGREDAAGIARYTAFRDLKMLVFDKYNSLSKVENPENADIDTEGNSLMAPKKGKG